MISFILTSVRPSSFQPSIVLSFIPSIHLSFQPFFHPCHQQFNHSSYHPSFNPFSQHFVFLHPVLPSSFHTSFILLHPSILPSACVLQKELTGYTDRQADRQTVRQTDKHTDKPINRLMCIHARGQASRKLQMKQRRNKQKMEKV